MAQLRLALAQVNPTVGDLAGNCDLVIHRAHEAVREGAHLLAFPEMMITGYPIEDLALRRSFQRASRRAVEELAARLVSEGLGALPVIVGYLDYIEAMGDQLGVPRGAPINAAAVLHEGRIVARYAKHHLPNYGVFDEFRYFVPGTELTVLRVRGIDVAIAICEDLWQDGGPVAAVADTDVALLVVINGSPYEVNKDDVRFDLCATRAREANSALAYVNMVGGQDELVFDGDSIVVDRHGDLISRAPQFVQTLMITDLELPEAQAGVTHIDQTAIVTLSAVAVPGYAPTAATVANPLSTEEEIYRALVLALGDYVRKNGFTSVILGLSGGIDSALVAAIAVDALGPENVHGVSMPSVHSSQHSRDDAADLAERTSLHFRTVEIAPMVDAFEAQLNLTGLAAENLQARVRGVTLMGISNEEGQLVLATGNKSELAVGYSTIYGDAVGGYAPIKDVAKTQVWNLSRWRNEDAIAKGQTPPIPPNSIEKEPSAELRPGQLDSDSLPDYDVLDDVLDDYVENDRSAAELIADGFDPDLVLRVLRLTDLAEYKRRQYPPGTKISSRAFGRDRRLPITNKWRERPL